MAIIKKTIGATLSFLRKCRDWLFKSNWEPFKPKPRLKWCVAYFLSDELVYYRAFQLLCLGDEVLEEKPPYTHYYVCGNDEWIARTIACKAMEETLRERKRRRRREFKRVLAEKGFTPEQVKVVADVLRKDRKLL